MADVGLEAPDYVINGCFGLGIPEGVLGSLRGILHTAHIDQSAAVGESLAGLAFLYP
jgi:hypothetical protein